MKLKRYNKILSILISLSMLLVLLVPLATPALASATYTTIAAPYVADEANKALGKVKVSVDVNDLTATDQVFFKLPKDFTLFPNTVVDAGPAGIINDDVIVNNAEAVGVNSIENAVTGANYVTVTAPAAKNALFPGTGALPNNVTLALISDNEFSITYTGANLTGAEINGVLQVEFNLIYVPAFDGDITAQITAPAGSGFSSGQAVIGRTSAGQVTASATETETSDGVFETTIRFSENITGALEAVNESLEFTLPDGFEWVTLVGGTHIWGDNVVGTIAVGDFTGWNTDEIDLNNTFTASTVDPSCFELTFRFQVVDETEAETGDVIAKLTGESGVTPAELVIGTYGELDATISVESVNDVVAGMQEQELADILVKESIKGSLVNGRTVTIELPAQARWQRELGGAAAPANATASKGVNLNGTDYLGTDNRMAKYTVAGAPSTGAAEIKIEDLEIMVEPGYTGDIVAKVAGSAGLSGELVLAKAVSPVKLTSSDKPIISLGKAGQLAGDITITENSAGALDEADVILRAPVDVEFDGVPTVEVTAGDIKIDKNSITRANGNRDLTFIIDRDSKTASTIVVSNIKYKAYRTIPEGDIKVLLMGAAVIDNTPVVGAAAAEWPNTTNAGSTINATCGTPAPEETTATSVFKIGDSLYTVNGVEKTMDVAPYIKGDRTYMPLRFVAQAAGVSDANIMWNAADQSVVLIKGDRVVKLVIGNNTLLINGIALTMDAAPEIVDPGRTMLPLRAVAQALGCSVEWDAATQSVTVK